MPFKDLYEVFDPRLALPIDGRVYHIPEPDAELGLWCQAMLVAGWKISSGGAPDGEAPPLQLDADDPEAFNRRMLGEAYDELIQAGHGPGTMRRVVETAFYWITLGVQVAEDYWNSGGDPKATVRPVNRAARRASTNTAGASTTKRQGSTSTTTSRPTNSKRSAGPQSPGK